MGCIYMGNWKGECTLWDKGSSLNPEGADEKGFCSTDGDPDPSWCQSYEYNRDGSEEDEEVCDYCGEPLGFCAFGCETLEEDFDE